MNQSDRLDTENLISEFLRIKALGFVRSHRPHNTGVGKTFEDLLGKKEDNKKEADFEGIEVKSQREAASSYITLFTKSPSFPVGANAILRDNYGAEVGGTDGIIRKLHTSVFGNKYNSYRELYGFKLNVNESQKLVSFLIKDLRTDALISDAIGWNFADIEKAAAKTNTLFVVWADKKTQNGVEYFHYTKAMIYHGFIMKNFVKAMVDGRIMVDLRIGTYKSGKNVGKTHDHGTGFRVKREFLKELFEDCEEVS